MKIKIPYELKMKFVTLEGFCMHREYYNINVLGDPCKQAVLGEPMIYIKLDLSDEPELLKCCIEWQSIIETYFKTSYKAYRIDIGPYRGLWPREITPEGVVEFNVDVADTKNGNWKDWFIQEDFEYAPK
jgi:hypothetical protein